MYNGLQWEIAQGFRGGEIVDLSNYDVYVPPHQPLVLGSTAALDPDGFVIYTMPPGYNTTYSFIIQYGGKKYLCQSCIYFTQRMW